MRSLSPRVIFFLEYDNGIEIQEQRHGLMPSAHIVGLAVEFMVGGQRFTMDDVRKCDWSIFGDLIVSLPKLRKVILCLPSKSDVKAFQDDIIHYTPVLGESTKLCFAWSWLEAAPLWCLDDSPDGACTAGCQFFFQ